MIPGMNPVDDEAGSADDEASSADDEADPRGNAACAAGDRDVVGQGIDPAVQRERITSFIRDRVGAADADGVVVNMSGGLDSTVTATLAVEALGPDRVYALVLPCNKTGAIHARDAESLAEALGIACDTIHLQPLFARFEADAPDRFDLHDEPVLTGNLVARFRATMAYLAANATNGLVLGTTNGSERLLGYFTKHGDGAADLLPIGHLYKTDVMRLAATLDVPQFVREKRPAAGFVPGQVDRDDLGAPYDVVDPILQLATETDRAPTGPDVRSVATRLDVDPVLVERLIARHRRTAHKRHPPPTPETRN